jgi:hypothetical protein
MSEETWIYYTVYFAGPVTIDVNATSAESAADQAITILQHNVPDWRNHRLLGVFNFTTAEERQKFVTLHILP